MLMTRPLAACALLLSVHAHAITGNEFLELFDRNKTGAALYMAGFLEGSATMVGNAPDPKAAAQWCPPPDVVYGQFIDIAVNSLRSNPKNRHMRAPILFLVVFRETWPCAR